MPKKTETKLDNSSVEATNRPKRVPLHKRKVLAAPEIPGYVVRYVNESYGRVEAFLEAGWTFVENSSKDASEVGTNGSAVGSLHRVVVNKDPMSSAKTAVLMKIPEDIYFEAQLDKQAENDDTEAQLDPKRMSQEGTHYGEMKITKNK